jgi:hypothetical protein
MARIQDGKGGAGLVAVSPNQKAVAVTAEPSGPIRGAYRWGDSTGAIAAGAGAGEVCQFRWTSEAFYAIIRRIIVSVSVSTTQFAAGVPEQLDIILASEWTGQGTLGTAVSLSNGGKARSTMPNSLVASGDLRISTTAVLGAGTKVVAAASSGAVDLPCPITGSLHGLILPPTDLLQLSGYDAEYPLVLGLFEGFTLNIAARPITGVHKIAVRIAWDEVEAF